jgi:hypothetical protein
LTGLFLLLLEGLFGLLGFIRILFLQIIDELILLLKIKSVADRPLNKVAYR